MPKEDKSKKEIIKKEISSKKDEKNDSTSVDTIKKSDPKIKTNEKPVIVNKQVQDPKNSNLKDPTNKPTDKNENQNKTPNKITNNKILMIMVYIFIGFLIIVAIAFIIFIFFISSYLNKPSENLSFSNDIKEVAIGPDMNALFIKFLDKNRTTAETSAKVKILLKNINGTEYIINTNKTIIDLILSEVSIPSKKSLLDIFSQSNDLSYDITIKASDIKGLKSLNEIAYVGILLDKIASSTNLSTNPNTNVTNTTRHRITNSSSDTSTTTTTKTTTTTTCNNTAWVNVSYICSSGSRYVYQTRTLCATGDLDSRNLPADCPNQFYCYDGLGSPDSRCVNYSFICTDSDNGVVSNISGFVNVSNSPGQSLIFNDSCKDVKNLTEYSCSFDGTQFIALNQTISCTYGCSNGACIICNDSDKDGYSADGGLCGPVDCNDADANLWKNVSLYLDNDNDGYGSGTQVIMCIGNTIPTGYSTVATDCDDSDPNMNPGIANSCVNITQGLDAYYKFNNSLDNRVIIDEKNNYNASCQDPNCPLFVPLNGLNGSGAYNFTGNSYITVPTTALNNQSYSISFWIKPSEINGLMTLLFSNAGPTNNVTMNIYYDPVSKKIHIFNDYGMDSSTASSVLQINQWYHLVYTFNSQENIAKLYINGNLSTSNNVFSQNPDPVLFRIGSDTGSSSFKGLIDEVRIYNRDINQAEISQLYQENGVSLYSMNFIKSFIDFFKNLFK